MPSCWWCCVCLPRSASSPSLCSLWASARGPVRSRRSCRAGRITPSKLSDRPENTFHYFADRPGTLLPAKHIWVYNCRRGCFSVLERPLLFLLLKLGNARLFDRSIDEICEATNICMMLEVWTHGISFTFHLAVDEVNGQQSCIIMQRLTSTPCSYVYTVLALMSLHSASVTL